MADIRALRQGLKTQLATISGLKAYAYMPIKPEPPCVGISIKAADLDLDLDANGRYTFDVWLYVHPGDLMVAQERLDEYLGDGDKSIKAALDADPSLGGAVDYAVFKGWSEGPRLVDTAGTQLLAMPLTVEIMSS